MSVVDLKTNVNSGMRIGMIPVPTQDEWEKNANPHLAILSSLLAKRGWEIVPLEYAQVTHPRRLAATGIDIIWIHWPSTLFDIQDFSSQGRFAHLVRLLRSKTDSVGRWSKGIFQLLLKLVQHLHGAYVSMYAPRKIQCIAGGLKNCTIPVVWQIHDIGSHHIVNETELARFDRQLHHDLFRVSAAIVIHERSCLEPISQEFGANRPYVVAELGPYSYGPSVDKHVARRRLGIETSGKVFAYLGTARSNRNPRASISSFCRVAGMADRLVLAGMGLCAFLPESCDGRIKVFDRFLSPDDYRDLICAADFVINDGERYLTSAVIRTALSYGVPVIAHPYGATLDMAHGAALFIGVDGMDGALRKALNMELDSYRLLCGEARRRNDERTWEESARKLDDFFRHVVSEVLD